MEADLLASRRANANIGRTRRRRPRSDHHGLEGIVSRSTFPQVARVLLLVSLAIACSAAPEKLSYDGDGVAKDVLALIPFNTTWARTKFPDAMLYRIELRNDSAQADGPPTVALYSFFSPGSRQFLTASSEPSIPWSGNEPQAWPSERPAPAPLPPVTLDFRDAWKKARESGVTNVSSAVLEVNGMNALPHVAWSVLGAMKDIRQRGVFLNALSGERLNGLELTEPPTSPVQSEMALTSIRNAFERSLTRTQTDGASRPGRCVGTAVPISAESGFRCYDFATHAFTAGTQ
jgi:hypothetical protein